MLFCQLYAIFDAYVCTFDAFHCRETTLRTTLNIDDQLYEEAARLTGVHEKTALLRESLKALIQREHARRLAQLGGSEPGLEDIPRRRDDG